MPGCLGLLVRLIVDAIIARIIQELAKRITGDKLIGWIIAILALLGIRVRRPGQ